VVTVREIDWLAGLFEGEGCADWMKKERSMRLRVQMTDRDVVERVAVLWGTKLCGPYTRKKRPKSLPMWTATVHGKKAVFWGLVLLGLMGERRTAKITELLMKSKEKAHAS